MLKSPSEKAETLELRISREFRRGVRGWWSGCGEQPTFQFLVHVEPPYPNARIQYDHDGKFQDDAGTVLIMSPNTLIFPRMSGWGRRAGPIMLTPGSAEALVPSRDGGSSVIKTWACAGIFEASGLRTIPFSMSASIVVYICYCSALAVHRYWA